MNEIIEKNLRTILQNTNPRYVKEVCDALESFVLELTAEYAKANKNSIREFASAMTPELGKELHEGLDGFKIMKENPRLTGLILVIKGKKFFETKIKKTNQN